MYTKNKWLAWRSERPKTQIFSESQGTEPPKTTETLFGVFVGSPLGKIQNILPIPDRVKLTLASSVLARAGVRLMELETGEFRPTTEEQWVRDAASKVFAENRKMQAAQYAGLSLEQKEELARLAERNERQIPGRGKS
jgi:hypothetical protein